MNLPKGWITAPLITVCSEIIGGGTPSREVPEYFSGDILWLTPTEIPKDKVSLIHDSREKITQEGLRKSSARLIPAGSVLLTSRASIGYVAISGREVTTNQGFASFVCSDSIHNFYLAYWLWANKELLENKATGTTFKEISKSKLRELSIPLPPLPEQRRIVSKIDELFSDLDVGVSSLKKAKAELARFRQSVLSHAFSGKLTAGWRKTHRNELGPATALLERIRAERRKNPKTKYKDMSPTEASDLPELPEGWEWTNVGEIAESMKNGIYKAREFYNDDGVACLRMYNIEEGKIIWKNIKRMNLTKEEVEEYGLEPGDILVNRVNSRELVGKAAPIPLGLEKCVYESKNIRLRLQKEYAETKYVSYWFQIYSQKYFNRNAQQTVGMASINQEQISAMPIPLSSLQEQQLIVSEIDRRFSIIDSMEKTIDQSRIEANRLRQSILKRAFEGKLVPQDPRDEPANILLEKIKKQRS